jgi:iron complex outermembrane receptor protein
MEFSDEIVKSGQVDRFGQPITGNADRTRHVGIELNGRWNILPALELAGNATLSRNRFVRHLDYSAGSARNLGGNPIAGFPDVLANLRLSYSQAQFSATVRGRYVGKQYIDNFRNESNTVDPFFVSDAWLSYRFDHVVDNVGLEVKLQVNNIFDALYAAYGEGEQFFVGAERNVFVNVALSL